MTVPSWNIWSGLDPILVLPTDSKVTTWPEFEMTEGSMNILVNALNSLATGALLNTPSILWRKQADWTNEYRISKRTQWNS
jgi:hypothetical protein